MTSHPRFPEIITPLFDLIGVTAVALCIFLAWQYNEQYLRLRGMETFFVQCMAGKTLVVDRTEAVRCIRL